MNARILNRNNQPPSDGWFQIEVNGLHPAGEGRKQLIDKKALTAIVNRFNAERDAAGEDFAGMLVDLDHLSHDLTNSTEAWAWLKEVEIRNNQLWGKLDLTDLGEAAIRNKRVKWFSTEYDPPDIETVEAGVVRPLRLAGLAFTNRPNNRGGKPISNRADPAAGEDKNKTKTEMKNIAEKLGLPADADETAILAKLTDIMSELDTMKGKQAETEVVEIMNRFKGRILPEKEGEVKALLIKNRADTVAMLELIPEPKAEEKKAPDRIFNRDGKQAPDAVGDAAKKDSEQKAAAIRNRASAIQQTEGLPFNQAFARASAELA